MMPRTMLSKHASGSYTATDRDALNVEFEALTAEIERVADNTQWNGTNLLDGASAFVFQIGANASQTVSVTINDFETVPEWINICF